VGLLFFVGIAALAAGVYYFSRLSAKKRREAFSGLAHQHGLSYHPDDPFDTTQMPFQVFQRGHSRKVSNVLVGSSPSGGEVRAFDYQYTTGSGKNQTTHTRSCVMGWTGGKWPQLGLEHEGFFSRFKDFVGIRDIELESEEFNRVFEVRCDDRRFATTLIDGQMMEFLLHAGVDDGVEVHGPWVLQTFNRHHPAALIALVQRADAFRARIPALVWELYPPQA
jgi:hypothetical protein